MLSRQFLLFLLTGGFAALVNFASRFVYEQWVGFSLAVVLAYLTGMVTAYLLSRWLVFTRSGQSTARSVLFFCLVNGLAVAQTWAVSLLLAEWLLPAAGLRQHVHTLAHAVGIVVPVFTSYLGHKHFSFKEAAR